MSEAFDALAKRRGLYFPANESYGGVAGLYTYGPTGAALKRNVEERWRERFVRREGNDEIDAPTVVPEAVFEASGHRDGFDDAVVACPDCDARHRADHLVEDATDLPEAEGLDLVALEDVIATRDVRCPSCGARLAGQPVEPFDLMFPTSIGPTDDETGYLRPETAQSTLVEFPRLREYARQRLPFGVAQTGRGYRNEISPRNAVVRSREFTMAELQQFFDPESDDPPLPRVADVTLRLVPADHPSATAHARADDERESHADDERERHAGDEHERHAGDERERHAGEDAHSPVERTVAEAVEDGLVEPAWLAYYLGVTREWLAEVGVDPDRLRFRQHADDELAHYATACWDAEARVRGEWVELAGLADRADYDLATHAEHTGEDYTVFREYDEPRERERRVVDADASVLGPRFGDRLDDVLDELDRLADERPELFDRESIPVELDDEGRAPSDGRTESGDPETVEIDSEHVELRVETVTARGEHRRPHVVEPAFGIDRVVYAAARHRYREDVVDGEPRTRLALPPEVAPTDVAVLPLRADVAERAERLADRLRRRGFEVTDDDSGSIGRRYRRQDEIGTPYCVTLDEETPDDDAATVRERDSTAQVRVPLDDLDRTLARLRDGETTVAEIRDETSISRRGR